ncbi:MAG: ferric reductase-like transmembrane domain-containing protein [Azoarcus sp.]|jgi:predicted ferric reductase|nr:ferric reductase-like transmembrane domain-containing protein [Azoarcus sp.]
MKKIKLVFGALFGVLTILWLCAEQPWAQSYDNFFKIRSAVVDYTGFIAMGAMSLAMMLAIRPVTAEPWLGGLDKSYRLHKWLGISALVVGIVHWLWAEGVKWAVGWGWLERPQRGPRPVIEEPIQRFFMEMRHPAEQIGEWAFYAAAVLILLALIKWFPYRYFFKTHRFIAIAYLTLVVHAVFLVKFQYWADISPIAWVTALLMAGGTIGAVLSLTRRIGHQRRALGRVESVGHNADDQVLEINVLLPHDRWDGHDAGQFAFVSFDDGEGAHPFTISSAWKNDGRLRFHVKNLGDYTGALPSELKADSPATVEGPYGCFRFESDKPRQIWVGAGIGITPFIARMEELVHHSTEQKPQSTIHLFYCTRNPADTFIAHLQQLSEASGVTLRVMVDGRDGLLNAEKLCAEVPEWEEASLWFCGPTGFGHALRRGLAEHGYDTSHFHQELFEMR